jgi:hypothetical protein
VEAAADPGSCSRCSSLLFCSGICNTQKKKTPQGGFVFFFCGGGGGVGPDEDDLFSTSWTKLLLKLAFERRGRPAELLI